MSRADALLSKLKDSLAKPDEGQNSQLPHHRTPPARELRTHSASRGSETFDEAKNLLGSQTTIRSTRVPLCFSVYETDVQRLDEIRDFMRGKGYRNISNSEALRLACRAVEIGDHFVDVYEQMRKEDGRRK
jgi:hypothetical protein